MWKNAEHAQSLLEAGEDLVLAVRIDGSVLPIVVHFGARRQKAGRRKGDTYVVLGWIRIIVVGLVLVLVGVGWVGLYVAMVVLGGDLRAEKRVVSRSFSYAADRERTRRNRAYDFAEFTMALRADHAILVVVPLVRTPMAEDNLPIVGQVEVARIAATAVGAWGEGHC